MTSAHAGGAIAVKLTTEWCKIDRGGLMSDDTHWQRSLIVSGYFDEPVFKLSQSSHTLQSALFKTLKPYGLLLDGIQEVGAYSGPSGWSLSMRFLQYAAQLQLSVQRYELNIRTLPESAPIADQGTILSAIEETVGKEITPVEVAKREVALHTHYKVRPAFTIEEKFGVTASDSLGTVDGAAISLQLQDPLIDGGVTVSFDRSVLYENAVFVTVGGAFDARQRAPHESVDNLTTFLSRVVDFIEENE